MPLEAPATDVLMQAIEKLAAPGSVGLLGWWLSGRFRKTEELARVQAEKVEAKTEQAIEKHEAVDQVRHDQNLENFNEVKEELGEIKVKLARAGINGQH